MLRALPWLLVALALASFATPAVAKKKDGHQGHKITICHLPPGKVVLDASENVVLGKGGSKVVKIRTSVSALPGHGLAESLSEALGEHKRHKYDFVANAEGECVKTSEPPDSPAAPAAEPEPEPEPAPEVEPEPDLGVVPE